MEEPNTTYQVGKHSFREGSKLVINVKGCLGSKDLLEPLRERESRILDLLGNSIR